MVFDDIKVGDVFRDKGRPWIELTVTALTDYGFKYNCTPHHVLPARFGSSEVTHGELFIKTHYHIDWDGYYEKIEPPHGENI